MKKMFVLMLVCSLASYASAATVLISVDGVIDPPDTSITLQESESCVIDLHGFVGADEPLAGYLVVQGQGTMTGGVLVAGDGAIESHDPADDIFPGYPSYGTWGEFMDTMGYVGTNAMIYLIELSSKVGDPPPDLDGLLVDEIIYHCTGEGDGVITFFNPDTAEVYDTQVIHQPEPATIALLGLGGLLLRRRK